MWWHSVKAKCSLDVIVRILKPFHCDKFVTFPSWIVIFFGLKSIHYFIIMFLDFLIVNLFQLQLQRFIKREMEKNEFTAALANWELVFFMVCCQFVATLVFKVCVLLTTSFLVGNTPNHMGKISGFCFSYFPNIWCLVVTFVKIALAWMISKCERRNICNA